MYPCNECAKDIIQAGIKHIVYLTNPYEQQWQTQASKKMLDMLDISVIKHEWSTPPQDILKTLVGVT
jgi:dCMP deaminase